MAKILKNPDRLNLKDPSKEYSLLPGTENKDPKAEKLLFDTFEEDVPDEKSYRLKKRDIKAELKNTATQTLIEIGKNRLKDSLLKVFNKKIYTHKKEKVLHTDQPGENEIHIKE